MLQGVRPGWSKSPEPTLLSWPCPDTQSQHPSSQAPSIQMPNSRGGGWGTLSRAGCPASRLLLRLLRDPHSPWWSRRAAEWGKTLSRMFCAGGVCACAVPRLEQGFRGMGSSSSCWGLHSEHEQSHLKTTLKPQQVVQRRKRGMPDLRDTVRTRGCLWRTPKVNFGSRQCWVHAVLPAPCWAEGWDGAYANGGHEEIWGCSLKGWVPGDTGGCQPSLTLLLGPACWPRNPRGSARRCLPQAAPARARHGATGTPGLAVTFRVTNGKCPGDKAGTGPRGQAGLARAGDVSGRALLHAWR